MSKDCVRGFSFENKGVMVVVDGSRKNGTGGILCVTKQCTIWAAFSGLRDSHL